jgi:hypothetical protein
MVETMSAAVNVTRRAGMTVRRKLCVDRRKMTAGRLLCEPQPGKARAAQAGYIPVYVLAKILITISLSNSLSSLLQYFVQFFGRRSRAASADA